MAYTIPSQTRIGHVHLKVSNMERSLAFYQGLLGFKITQWYGTSACFLSAGGYHHHIGLNTWHSQNGAPSPIENAGLYHVAILYPTERDLGIALKRLMEAKCPLTGASDHGVSKALYLNDPDRNGVELYWDRPEDQWPKHGDGSLAMITEPLDLEALLALAK